MKFKPGFDNYIILGVTGKTSCRKNDIYLNGVFISSIKTDHGTSMDYVVDINSSLIQAEKNRVTISHDIGEKCYGFDLYKIKTSYNACRCSN